MAAGTYYDSDLGGWGEFAQAAETVGGGSVGKAKRAKNKQLGQQLKGEFGSKTPKGIAKSMLMEDLLKLKKDPRSFGLTEAQRQKMIGESRMTAEQGAGSLARQLSREAKGVGGVSGGQIVEAARQAGAGVGDAAAQASARAQAMSEEMIARKAAEIQNRLAAAARQQQQATQYYTNLGMTAAQPVVEETGKVASGALAAALGVEESK